MAELKISELSAAVQVLDSDILPMTSGTSTVKVSAEQIKNYVADSLDVSDSAVTGSYVTAVAEVNGKVSVTREAADASPTENSNKLVKSGGVYTALAAKQNTLTFDNAPTENSDNPVKSGGIKTALDAKQNTLTFDNTPTSGSSNPVTSAGIKAALDNAGGHTIKDQSATYPNRKNLVFKGFLLEDDQTNNATIIKKDRFSGVTWANGSDADIAAMLTAHYNNEIDIHDYWSVGDERTVTLSAMSATGVGESHAQQQVTFVLMNAGGKTLATAVNGHTECAFIVGQKNSLAERGYMNSSNTNTGGWNSSARRTWCNNVYKAAIPSDFRSLFKQHKNLSGTGGGSSSGTQQTTDYFALPAEIEVFGSTTYSVAGEGSQFKYYETSANRIKTQGEGGSAYDWWERSHLSGYSSGFCDVYDSGYAGNASAANYRALAPFGCI